MYFNELKDEELENENLRLHAAARTIQRNENKPLKHSEYGLCSNCINFSIIRSEFKILRVMCSAFGESRLIQLDTRTPITECTEHIKRGQMSLFDMQQFAILINPKKPARIGMV